MLAILEDGLRSFQKHCLARTWQGQKAYLEACEWIFRDDADYIFSFRNVCESLDIDPEFLRAELHRWREKRAAEGRRRPRRRRRGSLSL